MTNQPSGCSADSRQGAGTAWVALVIVTGMPKVTTLRDRIHGASRPKIRFLLASSTP
jgi:hypothetical protein